jgi:serine phosphatase RsbU (regulator of sigma subunit)/CHASE2 domain-containing sensor protein
MAPAARALLRPARSVGIALLALGLALHLAAGPSGMPWRHAWWDLLHRLAPRERTDAGAGPSAAPLAAPPAAPAVIVAIDDETTRALGPWPWPRDLLAKLVRRIDEHGAAALALAIVLDAPDPLSPPRLAARYRMQGETRAAEALAGLADTDGVLFEALRQLPVALPLAGVPDMPAGARGRGCAFPPPQVRATGPPPDLEAGYDVAIPPLAGRMAERPGLSSLSLGAVGLRARGLVLRELEAVQRICGAPVLMLGVEALRLARGAGYSVIRPSPTGLSVFLGDPDDPATPRFPVERDGSFWVHFAPRGDAVERHARYVPAAALFRPGFDGARIAGRIVLLAVVGHGRADEYRSPLGELVWDVDAQLQMIEQIVARDFLRRPWFMTGAETALMLLGCLLVIALVPAARPEVAVGMVAAGVAAVMGAGYLAFLAGLLVDAAAPAVGITVVAAGTLTATLVDRDRARLLSEVALAGERADRAQLQGELSAAGRMQALLLPAPRFRLPGRLDLAARVEPARIVGGDFYDHFMLDDRRLLFLVADVSGKGAQASQFMLLSKTLLKSVALRAVLDLGPDLGPDVGPDLGAILRAANAEILRENPATMFVTGFSGLLEVGTGALAYASAGHDAPFLFGNGRPPAQLATDAGPPLGLADDAEYPVARCRLAPGDRLCLFSDGISEAMNAAGGAFGRDRLRAALAEAPAEGDSAAILAAILARTKAFAGSAEQSDDLTLMVLSVACDEPASASSGRM